MTDRSYEDDEIGVICAACSYEAKKTVGWVRKHIQLECPNCGAMVDIESRNFRPAASSGQKRQPRDKNTK